MEEEEEAAGRLCGHGEKKRKRGGSNSQQQEEIQRNQGTGQRDSHQLCGGKGIQHQGHIFHAFLPHRPPELHFIFSILYSLLDKYVCFTPHTYITIIYR
jgi:hypothetical protein